MYQQQSREWLWEIRAPASVCVHGEPAHVQNRICVQGMLGNETLIFGWCLISAQAGTEG